MLPIEKKISTFIERQFPSFYHEEGENFIKFVQAYYEWLETPTQTLDLTDASEFSVGDTVTQTLSSTSIATGTILLIEDNRVLVELTGDEHFRCIRRCGVVSSVISSNNKITTIEYSSSDNVIYQARKLPEYKDIDTTIDKFILHFKEKYLKNIQFDAATNKKLLIKNSFDLYRSKGTSRSIDLFFKLIYGVPAEVYYPGDDIFRLSDGVWVKPQYLEVTSTNRSIDYVGKQITGVNSGATAFVEKYIKRKIKGGVVDILYVSNPVGNFINNEYLKSDSLYSDSPRVIGSLNRVEIVSGSRLYEVGDIVEFVSTKGDRGKARVTEVANTSGVVDFLLIEGGWGYTLNAESLVSEKVLTLSNVTTSNTDYYTLFEQITQPLSNIVFISANNTFSLEDMIYRYHPNNDVAGVGKIVSITQTTGESNGEMTLSITNGSFTGSGYIFKAANTIRADVSSHTSKNATANVIGVSTNGSLIVNSVVGSLSSRIEIYQANSTSEYANAYVDSVVSSGGIYTLTVSNMKGAFRRGSGDKIKTRDGAANAVLQSVEISVGAYDIGNTFNAESAYVTCQNSGTIAYVSGISAGYGAGFGVATIGETETIFINTDLINSNNDGYTAANSSPVSPKPYLSLNISEYAYGFPKYNQGNLTSIIFSCLNFQHFDMGEIGTIGSIDPGADYNVDPYVLVYEPYIAAFNRKDYVIEIENATKTFTAGEKILQTTGSLQRYILTVGNTSGFTTGESIYQGSIGSPTGTGTITTISTNTFVVDNITGTFSTSGNVNSYISAGTSNVSVANLTSLLYTAKGIVKDGSNSSVLFVKRIQFENLFDPGEQIVGQTSGATANIVSVAEDSNTIQIGLNAEVTANVVTANGSVVSLEIFDSGFGYSNGEIAQYASEDGELGEAKIIIDGLGTGEGYFKSSKGFLSDNKYIHDSDYYQEYSYDIISKLPFEKYADVFKKVMHTAGTKVFGSVSIDEEDSIIMQLAESEIEEEEV